MLDVIPNSVIPLEINSELNQRKINLSNNSEQNLAYKIRTTNYKSFVIVPNCGTLEPKQNTDIIIQFKFNSNIFPKPSDKVQIKYMTVNNNLKILNEVSTFLNNNENYLITLTLKVEIHNFWKNSTNYDSELYKYNNILNNSKNLNHSFDNCYNKSNSTSLIHSVNDSKENINSPSKSTISKNLKTLNTSYNDQDFNKNILNSVHEKNIENMNTHINKNILNSVHEKSIENMNTHINKNILNSVHEKSIENMNTPNKENNQTYRNTIINQSQYNTNNFQDNYSAFKSPRVSSKRSPSPNTNTTKKIISFNEIKEKYIYDFNDSIDSYEKKVIKQLMDQYRESETLNSDLKETLNNLKSKNEFYLLILICLVILLLAVMLNVTRNIERNECYCEKDDFNLF